MPRCFVIQPFDGGGPYDRRYEELLVPAIEHAGLEPYRVDRDPGATVLIDQIEQGIKQACVCVADISEDNPNVWFELGYAIANNRRVVLLCSHDRNGPFPFDVQHRPIVRYKTSSPSDFSSARSEIIQRLKAIQQSSHGEKGTRLVQQKDIPRAEIPGARTQQFHAYQAACYIVGITPAFPIPEAAREEYECLVHAVESEVLDAEGNELSYKCGFLNRSPEGKDMRHTLKLDRRTLRRYLVLQGRSIPEFLAERFDQMGQSGKLDSGVSGPSSIRSSAAPTLGADRKILDDFMKKVPSNGTIKFLKKQDFGYSFRRSWLKDIEDFYSERDGPDHEFLDPELEVSRQKFRESCMEFLALVATQTWSLRDEDWQAIPAEWKTEQPERLARALNELHQAADAVCSTYSNFVRLSRKKLAV